MWCVYGLGIAVCIVCSVVCASVFLFLLQYFRLIHFKKRVEWHFENPYNKRTKTIYIQLPMINTLDNSTIHHTLWMGRIGTGHRSASVLCLAFSSGGVHGKAHGLCLTEQQTVCLVFNTENFWFDWNTERDDPSLLHISQNRRHRWR